MVEPGAFFEVADGEFDHGMSPVVFIDLDRSAIAVGDERVVSPLVEQGGLSTFDAGPPHDETMTVVRGLGDLRVTRGPKPCTVLGDLHDERSIGFGADHPVRLAQPESCIQLARFSGSLDKIGETLERIDRRQP